MDGQKHETLDHESKDLEGKGVFLCLVLVKPTRPRKSSICLKTRTQIWQLFSDGSLLCCRLKMLV